MHRSGKQVRETTGGTTGAHRMSRTSRVLARIGFGTGAVVTTLAILVGIALVGGERTLSGLRGAFSLPSSDSVAHPLAEAAPAGSDPAGAPGTISDIESPTLTAPPTPAASGSGSVTTDLTGTASPTAIRGTGASRSEPVRSGPPTASASTTTRGGTGSAASLGPVEQVLAQINTARRSAGLAALTTAPGLVRSATAHSVKMAGGCGLSHQCAGEVGLGQRISATGIRWGAAGENIGEGGPEKDDPAAVAEMAKQLTGDMLAETAPNDGHRRNLLSTTFHHIGIALYRDAGGTVWMTQDFSD